MLTMAKRKKYRSWTPDQIKSARKDKLGLKQQQMADKIGVSLRTWISWERGEIAMPQPIQMLVQFLLDSQKKS